MYKIKAGNTADAAGQVQNIENVNFADQPPLIWTHSLPECALGNHATQPFYFI